MKSSSEFVRGKFEGGYLGIPLKAQIENCGKSEIVSLFDRWLPTNQPILEAGSGSGCWVAWFLRKGWRAIGIDWSTTLCARTKAEIPDTHFVSGDMGILPFKKSVFGSIVALGSIEHVPEGPIKILSNFRRCLVKSGIVIITVPCNGRVRRIVRCLATLFKVAKHNPLVRKLFGKSILRGKSLREIIKNMPNNWAADFHYDDKGWHFYQYQFTDKQMRSFFDETGFVVMKASVIMVDSGIYNTFGRISGTFDPLSGEVHLSAMGKLLRMFLPQTHVGHMLCYLLNK